MAINQNELKEALNLYLKDRTIDSKERRQFVEDEITFTDGWREQRSSF
ncbi:MAG: hypothetical protein U0X87_13845 [Anaerolineales bacterium]